LIANEATALPNRTGLPNEVTMIDRLTHRRSLEGALADLRAKYEKHPSGELARMIEQLHAEIAIRRGPASRIN
jgi:hypothetical protein